MLLWGKTFIDGILSFNKQSSNLINPDQINKAYYFLTLIAVSYIFGFYNFGMYNTLQTLGKTKITIFLALIPLAINILLNYILGVVLQLNIIGIGIATIIDRIVETIAITICFWTKKLRQYNPFLEKFIFNKTVFLNIQKQLYPLLVANGLYACFVFNNRLLVINYAGLNTFQALTLTLLFTNILMAFWNGIYIVVAYFVGASLGANNLELSLLNTYKISKFYYSVILFLTILFGTLSFFIIDITYPTINASIRELSSFILLFFTIGFVFSSGTVMFLSLLRTGGKTLLAALIDICFVFFLQIVFTWLLFAIGKLETKFVFLILSILEIVQFIVCLILVFKVNWFKNLITT
ncbi:hypothetical protein [Spiroplasma endosymbiont of Stenodema calcarata]|uniref:hypothetical protein n=1 Tax=Spiroplasma endosymbiont of Stenodema calcarata TaxID=3139328 RepID=UPI003CCB56EC